MQKQLFYRRWRLTKREWCFCGEGGVSCVSVSSMTTIAAEGNWAVFFFCWVISACIIGAIEKTTEVNTWILSTCSPLVTSCGEVTRVSKDVGCAPSEQNVLSSIVVCSNSVVHVVWVALNPTTGILQAQSFFFFSILGTKRATRGPVVVKQPDFRCRFRLLNFLANKQKNKQSFWRYIGNEKSH